MALTVSAQKIFMTGDSHVSIKKYPTRVGELLAERVPQARFDFWGIGGAGFYTFIKPQNMARLTDEKPDVLIVHLGTNDSYAHKFKRDFIQSNVTEFYNLFHAACPTTKIVFVTPFYNKNKKNGQWNLNGNTRLCAELLGNFVKTHPGTYLIDNNSTNGMDFIDNDWIRPDFVHLTDEGYRQLARQVTDALLDIPGILEVQSLPVDPE